MAASCDLDDRTFSWPPTDADLAGIDIVSTRSVKIREALGHSRGRGSGARGARSKATRRPPFTRTDGLLLLAAGMLLGAAVPSLDTAPPTRLGIRSAGAGASLTAPVVVRTTDTRSAARQTPDEPAPSLASMSSPAPLPAVVPRPPVPVDPRTQQVVAVLSAYGRAWSRLDARAARAVMPSTDVSALTRLFSSLREQRLTLSGCRVGGSGGTATATCTATRRYRPRQGDHSTRVERGRWHFKVVRTPQRWIIAGVDRG